MAGTAGSSLELSIYPAIIRRNLVETAFSVLKRRFGEALTARKYRYQIKEIKVEILIYNLVRWIRNSFIILFLEEFTYEKCTG
jgi:hypothetical protein